MKYLLEPEERKLLQELRDSKSATRDRTIIELVLNTGLRVQETRFLNVEDVWNGYEIRRHLVVRPETAKRCKAREVPLNHKIRSTLLDFIKWKRRKGETVLPDAPLFMSRKGNRVGQRTLQDMIENWLKRAGIEGYSFHSLRHTYSMKLRRRDIKLETIQKLLGHSTLQATGIYLEPSREELIEAAEAITR